MAYRAFAEVLMARSPLLHAITRALRLHRSAARAKMPILEYAGHAREERSLTRRRFLEMSAAAATLPLLASSCEQNAAPPASGSPTIAIVGGGIAGLHCAYRLKDLGIHATVYEAARRFGGRMFTDRQTFPDAMHCELGGELIDTGHRTLHDLAAELDIELFDYSMDDPSLDTTVVYIGGNKLTMQDILTGFAPIAPKIDEALAALADQNDRFVYYNRPNGGEALDAQSLSAWLDAAGASGPVRTLLEVAYTTEFGLDPDISNVLNMLLLISSDVQHFHIYGDSDELFRAKGGNDAFIARLAGALDGEQLHLETALEALREAPDGRYVLTFRRGSSSFDVTADHVVLALPFTRLRKVAVSLDFPPAKKLAIDELGYGTNAKLMCGFSSRPWRDMYGSNGATLSDLSFQSTWETSRLQPGSHGILTNYTGGQKGIEAGSGTAQDRMADFLNALEMLFPGAKAASSGKVVRFHWPTYPLVLGSYSAYKVGQYTTIAGVEAERYKNVHFAGEHTSLDAQGYMEGGALSGVIAAAEIAADLHVAAMKQTMTNERSALWTPRRRILARAQAARQNRRWHAIVARGKQAA